MSGDEIRNRKAMLFWEHKEAEDRLAALRRNASAVGKAIQQFGEWLETEPEKKLYTRDQEQHGLPVDRLDDRFPKAMSFDDALILADEIRKAIATEKNLREQLAHLP